MKDDHIATLSISQITKHIFLGADMCCGGDHYQYLHNQFHIKADLAIIKERLETPSDLLDAFLWLPVPDGQAPKPYQLAVAVSFIAAIVKHRQKIFIHCRLGHGRSPTVLAAYFISRGHTIDQALAKIKAKRPEIHLNQAQLAALKKYKSSQ